MNTVDVLRGAKEILADPERWNRGGYGTPQKTCLAGAINLVIAGDVHAGDPHPAKVALLKQIPYDRSIASFNDDPRTTHADLIDAFDRAILSLAGEGIASESRPAPDRRAKDSNVRTDAPPPAGAVA